MDKTFSPTYFSSQMTYVEAEAVEFSGFSFHRKRTASTAYASTASASTSLLHTSVERFRFCLHKWGVWPRGSSVFKGRRARHLPRAPLWGVTRIHFLYFWWKIYHPFIPKQITSKYSAFKGPPTETVMFRYFAFKGADNSNCMKVICFQRGPQLPLKCGSTVFSGV